LLFVPASAPVTPDLAWSVALGARMTRVACGGPALAVTLTDVARAARFVPVVRDDDRLQAGLVLAAREAEEQMGADLVEALAVARLLGSEGAWLAASPEAGPAIVEGCLPGDESGERRCSDEQANGGERLTPVSVTMREVDAARRLLAREEGVIASRRGAAGLAALIRARRTGRLPKLRSAVVLVANELGGTADGVPLALEETLDGRPVTLEDVCDDLRRATLLPPPG
jgi:hypothetical protein